MSTLRIGDRLLSRVNRARVSSVMCTEKRDVDLSYLRFLGDDESRFQVVIVKSVTYKLLKDLTRTELDDFGYVSPYNDRDLLTPDIDGFLSDIRKTEPDITKNSVVTIIAFQPILGG